MSTKNGSSTRQSVASVTCATREKASKRILSVRVCLKQQPARTLALDGDIGELAARIASRLAGRRAAVLRLWHAFFFSHHFKHFQ